jgi:hypothetical protein
MHVVALLRQPGGVDAGAAADVEDPRGRGRQVARDDLLRPHELDARIALIEPARLDAALVVGADLVVHELDPCIPSEDSTSVRTSMTREHVERNTITSLLTRVFMR